MSKRRVKKLPRTCLGRVLVPLHRPYFLAYLDPEAQLLARIASFAAGGEPWTTSLDSAA